MRLLPVQRRTIVVRVLTKERTGISTYILKGGHQTAVDRNGAGRHPPTLLAPALDPISCWRVEKAGDKVFVREKAQRSPRPAEGSGAARRARIQAPGRRRGACADSLGAVGWPGAVDWLGAAGSPGLAAGMTGE